MLLTNFRLFLTHDASSQDQFTFYLLPIIDGRVTKPRQAKAFNRSRLHRLREAQTFFFISSNKHI
jgi:hypothetical protein